MSPSAERRLSFFAADAMPFLRRKSSAVDTSPFDWCVCVCSVCVCVCVCVFVRVCV